MTRVQALNQRYAASAALARNGVEVVSAGDPPGARLNAAARRLLVAARDEGPGLWDDLVSATKALRWRLMTQPQPIEDNPAIREAAVDTLRQLRRLRGAVADVALLDELTAAVEAVRDSDPALGPHLDALIERHGPTDCIVVAASKSAQAALSEWLSPYDLRVLTAGGLVRDQPSAVRAIVIGPPRFFRSSLVTAPVTAAVSFLLPAWFQDRSIPRSALGAYAESSIRVASQVRTEGDVSEYEPSSAEGDAVVEAVEDFLPQPSWGSRRSADREPGSDEVVARKVLLSGEMAIWLDDGDRIRTLDPRQPAGERVTYTDVSAVRRGTYLLLRRGETERGSLHRAALAHLGASGETVNGLQRAWKQALELRIRQLGYRAVVRQLRAAGVRTADRARAWTDPYLVRPNRDEDFEKLLRWLDLQVQPTFGYATKLRRAHHQVSAEIREQLERTVSSVDLSALERDGYVGIEGSREGVRGIVATRVLAIAPFTEIVSRHDARVPFTDRSGHWLE